MSDEHDEPGEHNEIMAAARDAKAHKERARKSRDKRDKKGDGWSLGAIGLGVGVGSAAVAAALLYAGRNRSKRDED